MKWRPALAVIVYAVLLSVMALPVLLIILFRTMEMTSGLLATAEISALVLVPALALVVAYVLTRTITTPINALIAQTEEISRGGRAAIKPLRSYGTQEIATLSQSFLDLAGKLVDHSEYVRSFAAHVSHELKSPLTSIKGAAELLHDDEEDAPMTRAQRNHFLSNIIADAERLDTLLMRLRELARAELPKATGEVTVTDIISQLREHYSTIEITGKGATGIPVALSLEAAGIVFGNLAENARQHDTTTLEIEAACEGRTMTILVRDNGRGIPESDRTRIFQPFFSTRREEGGTGIGLDIVRAMLSSHGGTIRLHETQEPGAAFEVAVPLAC
jgi:signal transduction histidine kinase